MGVWWNPTITAVLLGGRLRIAIRLLRGRGLLIAIIALGRGGSIALLRMLWGRSSITSLISSSWIARHISRW
jgi:hypothetical protein